jgi:hypothetical protein
MALDLSLSAIVNASGSFLFLLAGIAIAVLARGSRRGLLLGGIAAFFGVAFVAENLLTFDGDDALKIWVYVATTLPASALAAILSADLVAKLPRGTRLGLAGVALLVALDGVLSVAANAHAQPDVGRQWFAGGSFAIRASFLFLAVAIGARLRLAPGESKLGAAWALVALSFGTWAVFNYEAGWSFHATRSHEPVRLVWQLSYTAPLALLGVLLTPGRGEVRARRWLLGGLLAAAGAGLVIGVFTIDPTIDPTAKDWGANGIVRMIGVVLLLHAVLRDGVLEVPLPQLVVGRGAVAATALAVLFIVAQIAQNFLAAQYGLLMGGIVAGAFLFMASPLQRAVESLREPERRHVAAQAASGSAAEDAYKAAVRLALRGGITRAEELELARIADAHGIRAVRAHELRDEAERERAAP